MRNYQDDDSRYVSVDPRASYAGPIGIEQCAGCSGLGTDTSSMTTVPAPAPVATGRPWWFWLAIGGGAGAILYLAHRSGILSNPGRRSELELAQDAAALAVQANVPTILWGAPGIGKTSWLEALGKAMNAKVFTVIGSTKDPADIGGMMLLSGDLTPPKWAREIRERSLAGLQSVLFLDEFSSMAPLVHAALLRVVRDKIAGECDLDPKNGPLRGNAVHVVCAANPRKEGAAAIDLPPPAANRMLHIDWRTPSAVGYGLGLVLGWPTPRIPALPPDWRSSDEAKIARNLITSFVQKREGLLFDFPKSQQSSQRGRAWPSPRSWEIAADALGAALSAGASSDVQAILVKGSVGDGPGQEFLNWFDARDLPDPEDLLRDPSSWDPPTDRPDILWSVANSVSFAVQKKPTLERWKQAWTFISIMNQKTKSAQSMVPLASDLLDLKTKVEDLKSAFPTKEELETFFDLFRLTGFVKAVQKKAPENKAVRITSGKKS